MPAIRLIFCSFTRTITGALTCLAIAAVLQPASTEAADNRRFTGAVKRAAVPKIPDRRPASAMKTPPVATRRTLPPASRALAPARKIGSIPARNPFLKSEPRRKPVPQKRIAQKKKKGVRPVLHSKKKKTTKSAARRIVKATPVKRPLPSRPLPTATTANTIPVVPPNSTTAAVMPLADHTTALQPIRQVVTNTVAPLPPSSSAPKPYSLSPQMNRPRPIRIQDPKKRGTVFLDMTKKNYR